MKIKGLEDIDARPRGPNDSDGPAVREDGQRRKDPSIPPACDAVEGRRGLIADALACDHSVPSGQCTSHFGQLGEHRADLAARAGHDDAPTIEDPHAAEVEPLDPLQVRRKSPTGAGLRGVDEGLESRGWPQPRQERRIGVERRSHGVELVCG